MRFPKDRALLASSILLTIMMLLGIVAVTYDAISIRNAEEIEEDTSRLMLNTERWLNHQQKIEVAIRNYVLTGDASQLAVMREQRQRAVEHERGIRDVLEAYAQEDVDARVRGLLAFTAGHLRQVDHVAALRSAGREREALQALVAVDSQQFIVGAEYMIDAITRELQDRRAEANSQVSRQALEGGISFGLMAVLIIALIWLSYAVTSRTQRRNRELSEMLLQKATHDALTGLPNRDLFYDRLSQSISLARRKRQYLAVLYLDLDGFKQVNDRHGHHIGDATLKEAARRLRSSVREVDTVSRLGGDEFAVVLNELKAPDDAAQVAEKIIKSIAAPMPLYGGKTYQIGTSIGIAIYPDSGIEIDRLMKAADNAMYESKAHGKNRFTYDAVQQGAGTGGWINFADDFRVGIAVIDEQHERLADMLNKLNVDLAMQRPLRELEKELEAFVASTMQHFATEEHLMDQYGYPDAAMHKQEHQRLIGEVQYLRAGLVEGGELLVLQWLKDWLVGHVAGSDRRLSEYLMAAGVS